MLLRLRPLQLNLLNFCNMMVLAALLFFITVNISLYIYRIHIGVRLKWVMPVPFLTII